MFERKDNSETFTDSSVGTDGGSSIATVAVPADQPDYGLFDGAKLTVLDGVATVTVPLRRGSLVLETDEPLLCAWAIDNAAGAVAAEAKKHKP